VQKIHSALSAKSAFLGKTAIAKFIRKSNLALKKVAVN
jgi:hypothetical protein